MNEEGVSVWMRVQRLLSSLLPVIPYLMHILHLVDLVSSEFLQNVEVEEGFLFLKAVHLYESH